MIKLQGFRIVKLNQVENPRLSPLLKITKTTKLTSSPEPFDIIGYKFVWIISYKNKKKSTAELGHSDLLSAYKSNFAKMPVSQENMNVFWSDLITMYLNQTILYICKLTIQDGRHGPLLKQHTDKNDNISRTVG